MYKRIAELKHGDMISDLTGDEPMMFEGMFPSLSNRPGSFIIVFRKGDSCSEDYITELCTESDRYFVVRSS